MTDEQINAAIAKACEWKPKRQTKLTRTGHFKVSYENPPDYCNDLNAMHEAEKMLKIGYCKEYKDNLYDAALELEKKTGRWMPYSLPARHRAEAFLRTLGKWEEVQG